jgi:hypothetical protein
MTLFTRFGAPLPLRRSIATRLGFSPPCKSDADCNPCETCAEQGAGPLCVPYCAACEKCEGDRCVSDCGPCLTCSKYAGVGGACIEDPDIERQCKDCDPNTGKITERCTACEKCDRGFCASNCPGRCEFCEGGKCRKCDGPCDYCDEAGTCITCDPRCERCNTSSSVCETTCAGGFSCCFGQCTTCCGECGRRETSTCLPSELSCPTQKGLGVTTVCCDKRCVDLLNEIDHCGTCGNRCRHMMFSVGSPYGEEICRDGQCVCWPKKELINGMLALGPPVECRKEGYECCEGDCVEIASYQSDPKHCGKCVVECESDEKCENGQCVRTRVSYRITFHHKRTTELRGIPLDYTYEAVVRQLRSPDANGNNFAGKGTYSGQAVNRKANCNNNFPEDVEPIAFQGRLRATASIPDEGGWVSFTLEPIDPPSMHFFTRSFRVLENLMIKETGEMPALIFPGVGMIELKGGTGHQVTEGEFGSNSCDGKVTVRTEFDITRLGGPKPKGARPKAAH